MRAVVSTLQDATTTDFASRASSRPDIEPRLGRDSRPTNRERAAAFTAAIALRAAIISLHVYEATHGDAKLYQRLATNLLAHGTLSAATSPPFEPSPLRPPFFPGFIAAIESITGQSLLGVQLVQILLSAGMTVLLARAVGRWVPRSERTVLWALCLLPFDGFYCGALLTETLASALLAAGVAVLLLGRSWRAWALAGALFGLLALTRDVYLFLPPFIAFFTFLLAKPRRGHRWHRMRFGAVLIAAELMVIAPWTVRNAIDFHRVIPITGGLMGFNLWIGTWERDSNWKPGEYPPYAFASPAEEATIEEWLQRPPMEVDKKFLHLATERMRSAPVHTAIVWLERFPRLWVGTRSDLFTPRFRFLSRGAPAWYVTKLALWVLNAALLVAGLAGMLSPWKGRLRTRLLLRILGIPLVATGLVYLPFHDTENRYSHPVLQFLIVSAAILLSHLWVRFRAPRTASAAS